MPTKPNDNGLLCYELVSNKRYLHYFLFYLGFQPPVYFHVIDCAAQFVNSNQRMVKITFILFVAIIVDSLYGCEELADILDAMGKYFVLCCRADRPAYVFSPLSENITEHGEYSWSAKPGYNNIIYALTLWNNPKKESKKKVVILVNVYY